MPQHVRPILYSSWATWLIWLKAGPTELLEQYSGDIFKAVLSLARSVMCSKPVCCYSCTHHHVQFIISCNPAINGTGRWQIRAEIHSDFQITRGRWRVWWVWKWVIWYNLHSLNPATHGRLQSSDREFPSPTPMEECFLEELGRISLNSLSSES